MHNEQHTREIFETDSETGDWQCRQEFDPRTFSNVIQDSALRRTFEAWQAGGDYDEALAAEIDVSNDNPGAYRILHHRNATAFGMPSEGLELYQTHDGPWGMHTRHLADEYREAKRDGIKCHAIWQEIDGEKRQYHRVMISDGRTLRVASAKFERE